MMIIQMVSMLITLQIDANGIPQFPYFIGDKYRSKVEDDNFELIKHLIS